MRFGRLGPAGRETPVLLADDSAYDLSGICDDIDGRFLASDGAASVAESLAGGGLRSIEMEGVRVGAPVARPGAVVCIGQNYAAHAAESGAPPPDVPILFFKPPNTVVGPFDPVPIPRGSTKTDWEVELGVVIARRALYLDSPEESWRYIGGFVVANDVSERDFQLDHSGGQWSKGKAAPGFTPLGPWLVTPDEVDTSGLRLKSWVNGEARQNSSTEDMIFDVAFLIWHLSQYMQLDPGDVVLTGTPEGVALSGRFPYLRVGDVVEVEIEKLGRQRQVFVDFRETLPA